MLILVLYCDGFCEISVPSCTRRTQSCFMSEKQPDDVTGRKYMIKIHGGCYKFPLTVRTMVMRAAVPDKSDHRNIVTFNI